MSFNSPRCSFLALAVLSSLAPVCAVDTVLLESTPPAAATALVPSLTNGGAALTLADWTLVADPPNVANWISGTTGVGYENSPGSTTSYSSLLGLDLLAVMRGNNETAYIRVPFSASEAVIGSTKGLTLEMKYDDGFIAYLNGVQVLSANPPAGIPNFQSGASDNQADQGALDGESFEITPFIGNLKVGENMLAIHGLNRGAGSSDFLIVPRLIASDVAPPEPPVWPDLQIGSPVIRNLVNPVDIVHAGDGSGRLFIVERAGRIRIWVGGALRTFLDIRSRVNTTDTGGTERGLLGLAFPPDYAQKNHFYVNYISNQAGRSGDTVVSRFSVNANNADDAIETSEEVLLVVDQPQSNHNGGQIHFGEDGYLYLGFGDGGGSGDNDNHGTIGNGQSVTTLLGKMQRLDVEGPADPGLPYAIPADNPFVNDGEVLDEIWAFGLRNPWRWSFDRKTGDMYIADVGQGTREEVSFAPAASVGGENYQWRQLEGFTTHNGGTPLTKGVSTDPIHDYPRSDGSSITGGYVYRGDTYPRMQGIYFFADYVSGRLWGLQRDPSGAWVDLEFFNTSFSISCFGEDEEGNLYFGSLDDGEVYRLTDTRGSQYLQIIEATFGDQGAVQMTFGTEVGKRYQLQFSTELENWENLGAPQTASQLTLTLNGVLLAPLPERAFIRAVEL